MRKMRCTVGHGIDHFGQLNAVLFHDRCTIPSSYTHLYLLYHILPPCCSYCLCHLLRSYHFFSLHILMFCQILPMSTPTSLDPLLKLVLLRSIRHCEPVRTKHDTLIQFASSSPRLSMPRPQPPFVRIFPAVPEAYHYCQRSPS